MANNNIGSQIISELGEIGKKVGGEIGKIPKDVAGKAMESMGATGSTNTKGQAAPLVSAQPGGEKSAWESIDAQPDRKVKRSFARRALQELSNRQLKQKEPSIWERLQQEQDAKKREKSLQQAASDSQLPVGTSKRPKGDLYGTKAKKTATENRNVRQD